MGEAIALRHRFGDVIEGLQPGLLRRLAAGGRGGVGKAGDGEAVPVGEDLVVAGGLRALVARSEQMRADFPQPALLVIAKPVARRPGEPVQDDLALPIALRRSVVDAGEAGKIASKRGFKLRPGPDIGQPFLVLGVGVEA